MATFCHFVVIVGILGLAHAAFSAAQHRSYIRLTEQEFTRLPADIVLECLLSLIVTCYGVINMAGKFKGIRAMAEFQNKKMETIVLTCMVTVYLGISREEMRKARRSMDTVGNRPSFYSFAHRGFKQHQEEAIDDS